MPKTRALCLRTNRYSYVSHADVRASVVLEKPEETIVDDDIEMVMLKGKLEEVGIDGEICTPGQHDHLIFPMVKAENTYQSCCVVVKNMQRCVYAVPNSSVFHSDDIMKIGKDVEESRISPTDFCKRLSVGVSFCRGLNISQRKYAFERS